MKATTITKTQLSDLYTPVGLFLKLRDRYAQLLLLESSDYSNKEGSYSFLVCDELMGIEINQGWAQVVSHIDNTSTKYEVDEAVTCVDQFLQSIELEGQASPFNGIFGFTSYDAIKYFEKGVYSKDQNPYPTPELKYGFFRFIIVFDHFKNKLIIIENIPFGDESKIDQIEEIIEKQDQHTYDFHTKGEVQSSMTDEEFMTIVSRCKNHCQRGDVFQIVPSRRYQTVFSGDEFNVYRQLRSVNPSPYLFYFDYTTYKLFGSSPEAQIIIQDQEAELHPIAGTIKRSLDPEKDKLATEKLIHDPKENAEHVMLVDLARNDLSKNCTDVRVCSFKEVQYFSHVIHLVSKVNGSLKSGISAYQVFADTFPQGTLSGAPKIKALEIIEANEPHHRGFYGGALGMIGFDNNLNHAIVIRSILSTNNTLYLQAGAGVVIDSIESLELKEVNNKLGALVQAINLLSK